MEKTEVWKSLDFMGYPDYEVSNLGRVKSLDKYINSCYGSKQLRKEKILKQGKCTNGYLKVVLVKNGKIKNFTIHRLVALAFIPNPENYNYVNHKDENKQNNKVENLEWCTAKYNTNYGTSIKKMSKAKSKPILQYTKDGIFIKEWDSATTASKELNISQGNITECCKGKRKSASGFIWRYKE